MGGWLSGRRCSGVLRSCEVRVEGMRGPERQAWCVVEWWRVVYAIRACIVVLSSWVPSGLLVVDGRWRSKGRKMDSADMFAGEEWERKRVCIVFCCIYMAVELHDQPRALRCETLLGALKRLVSRRGGQ